MDLDREIDAARDSFKIDLLTEGRRAKMLRVWAIYLETGRNVLKTSRRFGCSRNTVKLYVRLYEQEQFLESQGNPTE